jgi:selenocysteine lyase/cysteine desulfurase
VGVPWAVARTERLAGQLRAGLSAIDGVEVLGSGPATGPLLAFRIAGWQADEAAEELARSIFAILDADAEAGILRVSVGAWNLEDELSRFAERVAELAAHTPADLPRKPALTIIHAPRAEEPAS